MTTYPPSVLDPAWLGLVDDAAIFPPGNAPLDQATAAYTARLQEWYAGFVGAFVLRDTDLPQLTGFAGPLSVVVTGGAGQVAGPLGLAARHGLDVRSLEIALRDPDDLPGSARRVLAALDAARGEGVLGDDVTVHVELPQIEPTAGWLAAADMVAGAEHRLKFRTGGTEAHAFPSAGTLATWIDAALDRETPFKCTAGLHGPFRHRDAATGFEHHGFVNVLVATERAFEGADTDDVTTLLEERDVARMIGHAFDTDITRTRRWFTSFGSCSVTEPLEGLVATGLLEDV